MLTSQYLIDIDIKISLNDPHTSESYLDCFNNFDNFTRCIGQFE